MNLYQDALHTVLQRRLREHLSPTGVELVMAVITVHHHDHDHDPPTRASCTSCGHIPGMWCSTVTTIIDHVGLDIRLVDMAHREAVREHRVEKLAAIFCAELDHSHAGRPHCAGYQRAVRHIDEGGVDAEPSVCG